jgi:hypothetical protein
MVAFSQYSTLILGLIAVITISLKNVKLHRNRILEHLGCQAFCTPGEILKFFCCFLKKTLANEGFFDSFSQLANFTYLDKENPLANRRPEEYVFLHFTNFRAEKLLRFAVYYRQ